MWPASRIRRAKAFHLARRDKGKKEKEKKKKFENKIKNEQLKKPQNIYF